MNVPIFKNQKDTLVIGAPKLGNCVDQPETQKIKNNVRFLNKHQIKRGRPRLFSHSMFAQALCIFEHDGHCRYIR